MRPKGIIGVEVGAPSTNQITIQFQGTTTVREVLTELCAGDRRHRFVLADGDRIVNVLLLQPDRLSAFLTTKVAQFDMSLNAFPSNWYNHVADFSSDVRGLLERIYTEENGTRENTGAGANMETNVGHHMSSCIYET